MHSPQIHPPTSMECGTLRFAEHWSAYPSYTAASSARSSKDCLRKRSPLAWILSPGPRNRSLRKRLQWTGNSLRSNISSFCGSRQVKIIILGRVYQSQRIRRVIPKHNSIMSSTSPQIAPFHVELSVRETGLDFTKLRSAAVSLFTTKRPRDLIALNSNNALLEFLLEGSPEVRTDRVFLGS